MRAPSQLVIPLLVAIAFAACGDGATPRPTGTAEIGTTPAASGLDAALERGREVADLLLTRDATALWSTLDERMQLSFPTEDSIMGNFWWQVIGELGAHDQLISEHADRFLGYDRYTAVHTFESGPTQFALIAMLNADGGVGGLNVIPLEEAPSAYLDYETVTALRLPFDGEWLVVQGGRTAGVNQHAGHVDQRFAIDFVVVRDERSFGGEGVSLEDHYCFGMPVRAPASGVVVDALDGVADNGIGQPNESAPAGNYVLIDHGNGEFSVLAHLQNGSVEVEAGQQIQQGDVLGSCGNSGNSAEPHVHFHLQNGPTLFQAEALPATFVDYVANGDSVDRGEPVQGTTVEAR